jgi:hypothetical protein
LQPTFLARQLKAVQQNGSRLCSNTTQGADYRALAKKDGFFFAKVSNSITINRLSIEAKLKLEIEPRLNHKLSTIYKVQFNGEEDAIYRVDLQYRRQ